MNTLDMHLIALDAKSGRELWKTEMHDYTESGGYAATGAPLAVKDKVIVGMAGGEHPISGFLDAYDAATGKRLWRFNTIPQPGEANFGLEPSWTQLYPYQSLARPGDTLNLKVRMHNYLDHVAHAEVRLVLPEDWTVSPATIVIDVPPQQRAVANLQLHIPAQYSFPYPRVAIAADVTFDGRQMGQIAEATIEAVC